MNNIITAGKTQPGIYRIRNKANGKFYIGSTRNFRKRMREHLCNLRNNCHPNIHLQRSFNKHGETKFLFEIVEVVEDIDRLIDVEQKYLDTLRPFDLAIGYNISTVATSYAVYGEENPHYGIPKTEEHKRKISETLKGHRHSEETKRKISQAVKGKNAGKDHWSYGKERSKQHRERHSASMKGKFAGAKNPSAKKVVQLTVDGRYVNTFDTMREARRETGAHSSGIVNCCKGKAFTAGGFRWMYYEDFTGGDVVEQEESRQLYFQLL